MDGNRTSETAEPVELEESTLDQAAGGAINSKPAKPHKGGDPEDGGE